MSSDGSSYRKIRDFYIRQYRPLYDHFVTNGELPQELHAEVAAAFDHLFRKSPDGEGSLDPKDAEKVIAHIKRATFDAFKMMFKREIREPYDRLHTLTYADVDNGKFLPDVEKAWNEAKAIAIEARNLETGSWRHRLGRLACRVRKMERDNSVCREVLILGCKRQGCANAGKR